ncbi:hypothetical protein [Burkholderia cepacia]|uniref:hypothetical protein n=1 Tax=Burkholderia cepacia TaxID=292 RepID=UPI000F5FEC7C|nr:hypothetical protein [Burkholderia cepacia]RRA01926.1 hypothetical protein DF055_20150 [Burkholderia cepacia]RRA04959.1 hypothetical protein DF054_22950 [Burkholderia cepacia]
MNNTSPAATGTAGVAIAGLVVVISVGCKHLGIDMSPQDQVSLAAGVVASVHWLAEQYAARGKKPAAVALSVGGNQPSGAITLSPPPANPQ